MLRPSARRRRRSCEAMPIGGIVTVDHRLGVGAEVRGTRPRRRVDPGAVDHDHGRQPRDPLGLRQWGRSARLSAPIRKKRSSLGPFARGPPRASRRCSGGRAGWPRSRRPRRRGGPPRRSGPSPGGRRPCVRSPGLCGGAPATTNQTRSSPQASRHDSARIRCPRWIGSNVPPNSPSRIAWMTFFGGRGSVRFSCGQACRNRVK